MVESGAKIWRTNTIQYPMGQGHAKAAPRYVKGDGSTDFIIDYGIKIFGGCMGDLHPELCQGRQEGLGVLHRRHRLPVVDMEGTLGMRLPLAARARGEVAMGTTAKSASSAGTPGGPGTGWRLSSVIRSKGDFKGVKGKVIIKSMARAASLGPTRASPMTKEPRGTMLERPALKDGKSGLAQWGYAVKGAPKGGMEKDYDRHSDPGYWWLKRGKTTMTRKPGILERASGTLCTDIAYFGARMRLLCRMLEMEG